MLVLFDPVMLNVVFSFFFWLIGIRWCSKVQWCFNHSWKMFSLFLLLNVRMRLLTYVDVWWWFEVRKMWYFCVCRNFMRIRKSKNLKFLPSCFVWLVIFLRIAEVVSNAEKNRPNSCCNYQKVFFFLNVSVSYLKMEDRPNSEIDLLMNCFFEWMWLYVCGCEYFFLTKWMKMV